MPRGLNENYARELLELHTLGVDGGYTQQDIVEVAKAFTGWTIRGPRQGGGFWFDERRHVKGAKHVLGTTIDRRRRAGRRGGARSAGAPSRDGDVHRHEARAALRLRRRRRAALVERAADTFRRTRAAICAR